MSLTNPYRQKNYMGEYASDAACLTFIRANKWDSSNDGLGTAPSGAWYFNTTYGKPKISTNGTFDYFGTSTGSTLDWQESILEIYDNTSALPVGPTAGDRYIALVTANDWTANYIYEWDAVGEVWQETIPTAGAATMNEDTGKVIIYSGTAWSNLELTLDHNLLTGKQGGTTAEYYHLTSAQHSGLTGSGDTSLHTHDGRYFTESELGSTTADSEGAKLIGTDTKTNLNSATTVEVALTHLNGQNVRKYSTNAGNPNGTVAGAIGDECFDTSNLIFYKNTTGANTGWVVA